MQKSIISDAVIPDPVVPNPMASSPVTPNLATREESEKIRKDFDGKFDRLGTKLNELKSKVREMKHETRANWEKQLAEMERQQRTAKQHVDGFTTHSEEAWNEFKAGMEVAWKDLKRACADALQKFD